MLGSPVAAARARIEEVMQRNLSAAFPYLVRFLDVQSVCQVTFISRAKRLKSCFLEVMQILGAHTLRGLF
jgi:hypothetical protein